MVWKIRMNSLFCDFDFKEEKNLKRKIVVFVKEILNPAKKIMFFYRMGNRAYMKKHKFIAKLCGLHIYHHYNCQISMNASIGEKLYLPHPIGIVIGNGVKICKNVVIYQGVTIGRDKMDNDCYPCVEDDCILYASAKVLGGIKVRKGTIVGASAVLTRDTEENSVYVGIPAVRKNKNDTNRGAF